MSDTVEVGSVAPDEERIRVDSKPFRVVAIVAGVLFALMVLPQLLVPVLMAPSFVQMFSDMGGELPQPTAAVAFFGPWFSLILLAIDALIFWFFYRLARRYWIGLLFAPLIAVNVLTGLFVATLYAPMFSIVTLVK